MSNVSSPIPHIVGLGDRFESHLSCSESGPPNCPQASLNVYIANRPPLPVYEALDTLHSMVAGEIFHIADQTGNHWRKIFNVYAKFVYALNWRNCRQDYTSWQEYRDDALLQEGSGTRLMFNAPHGLSANHCLNESLLDSSKSSENRNIHIIMGKGYAQSLGFSPDSLKGLTKMSEDFSVMANANIIISPYFDYRQLSNLKIEQLVQWCRTLNK